MNILLVFFALPIATIILAIVIEKILRCPILTALTFFAIYLIVAFAVFNASFLIFVIAYTIIAYITAWITELFFCRCRRTCPCRERTCQCKENNNNNNEVQLSNADMQNIATRVANILNTTNNNCNCNCNNNNVATVNVRDTNGCQTTWCCRRR